MLRTQFMVSRLACRLAQLSAGEGTTSTETPSAQWLKDLLGKSKKTAQQEVLRFLEMSSAQPAGISAKPWIQVCHKWPLQLPHLTLMAISENKPLWSPGWLS